MVDLAESTVRVNIVLGANDIQAPQFGKTLLLYNSDTSIIEDLNRAETIRYPKVYSTLTAVLGDNYPDEVYAAATRYFSQNPFPKELLVGARAAVEQPTLMYGSVPTPANGNDFVLDHDSLTFNGQDFQMDWSAGNTPTTAAEVRTSLEDGLNAISTTGYTNIDVGVWDTDKILIQFPKAITVNSGFEDSNLMNALGLSPRQVTTLQKVDKDTNFSDTLNRFIEIGSEFFYVYVLPEALTTYDEHKDVADWVEGAKHFTAFDFKDNGIFTPNESTSIAARLYEGSYGRSAGFYSGTEYDYKGISYLAGFSSINFNSPQSLRTGRFMTLHGCAPTRLTETQLQEVTRKRVNAYIPGPGGGDVVDGTNFSGWTDVQIGIDWLRNTIEYDIYAVLKSGRVPQTEVGQSILLGRLIQTMRLAVRNGFLAPNEVSPAMAADIKNTIGDEAFNGYLSLGYLIHMEPISVLSQSRREQRQISPFKIWGKIAGAVHELDLNIVFEQ